MAAYVADLPSRQMYLKDIVDSQLCTKAQAVEYACLCAESVLHIFEQGYPQDQRPRRMIESARRWLLEPTEVNRLEAAYAVNASAAITIESYTMSAFMAAYVATIAANAVVAPSLFIAYAVDATKYTLAARAYATYARKLTI